MVAYNRHTLLLGRVLGGALLGIIAVLGIACSSGSTSNNGSEGDLKYNLEKWEGKNIANYSFTFQWKCFCMPDHVAPKRITVRGGAITAIKFAEGGKPLEPALYKNYRVIEELFVFVQDAVDRDAHEISALYDADYGYPAKVSVDYSEFVADEENGFAVTDFVME